MNQTQTVKDAINTCLESDMTDKYEIYTKVVEMTGCPRPTVRRVTGDLVRELKRKCEILKPKGCEGDVIESR